MTSAAPGQSALRTPSAWVLGVILTALAILAETWTSLTGLSLKLNDGTASRDGAPAMLIPNRGVIKVRAGVGLRSRAELMDG